jgi:DNA-binding transcriptional regulator YdaS (Cro superfamily)
MPVTGSSDAGREAILEQAELGERQIAAASDLAAERAAEAARLRAELRLSERLAQLLELRAELTKRHAAMNERYERLRGLRRRAGVS